jgi:eukaryotic-like serine/threonine-protein kinase
MGEPSPGHESLSLGAVEQIDGLCDRFEAEWRAGRRPLIEDYLGRVAERVRPHLLPELLRVDLEYRYAQGESPGGEEYRKRFPDEGSLIEDLFRTVPVQPGRVPGDGPPAGPGGQTSSVVPPPAVPGYEVLGVLGKGGMGVVYQARQASPSRLVALKVIRADRLEGLSPEQRQKALDRFRNEAQAAAQLEHDHIVGVFEVGEAAGRPFYSMRYVEGSSLHDLLRGGPLECRRAAGYVEQVARAVHEAHRHGILHRDLKPHNVLVEARTDRPLVADFGLAKLAQGGAAMTHTGDVMGTPAYMPPEQAVSSGRVTVAGDVYGLGATLYALLTGRPPFQADTPLETLRKVLGENPVPPRRLRPGVPRDLETVCLKSLRKEPAGRYASAADLADDLRRFLEGRPIAARPVGTLERAWRWCRRNRVLAGMATVASSLAVVILVGAPIAIFLLNQEGERTLGNWKRALTAEEDAKDKLGRAVAAEADALEKLRQAQAGRYSLQIAFAQQLVREGDILSAREVLADCPAELRHFEHHYLRALCRGRMRLVHPGSTASVTFSPDGKFVAAGTKGGKVQVWDVASRKTLHPAPLPHGDEGVTYTPDGSHLVSLLRPLPAGHSPEREALAKGEVRVWNARTGALRRSLKMRVPPNSFPVHIDISPDARWLAAGWVIGSFPGLTPEEEGHEDQFGTVYDLTTGKEVRTFQGAVGPLLFSPDGKYLVHGSANGNIPIRETSTFTTVRSLKGHQKWSMPGAFSSDGKRLVSIGLPWFKGASWDDLFPGEVRIWDVGSGEEHVLVNQAARCAAFSPDGREVAVGASGLVRVLDARTGREKFTYKGDFGTPFKLAFSPDGKWLASAGWDDRFLNFRDDGDPGKLILWQTAPVDRLELRHPNATHLAFSPDGKRVVSGSHATLKVWDALTSKLLLTQRLSRQEPLHGLAFNRAGNQIVAVSCTVSGKMVCQVRDARTGKELSSRTWEARVEWLSCVLSPDGQRLLAKIDPGKAGSPSLRDTMIWDTSTGQRLVDLRGGYHAAAFHPNGKSTALSTAWSVTILDGNSSRDVKHTYWKEATPTRLAFSGDGKRLAGRAGQRIKVWDTRTGRLLHSFPYRWPITSMALSRDGKRLATLSPGAVVRVWDVATGQDVLTLRTLSATSSDLNLRGREHTSATVAFSPDGERLAATSGGSVEVWSADPSPDDQERARREEVIPAGKNGFAKLASRHRSSRGS